METYMKKKYEDHRKRIREAKTTIDSSKPPEMPMTMRRESERRRQQTAIEKDNRLLLDRLAIAMTSKNIDNDLKAKPFTSYMELQRKKQLKKLQLENERMLERIQQTVPSYRHVEWELDAEKRVEYLRNMTEFPHLFVPPGSSRKSRTGSSNSQGRSRSRSGTRNDGQLGTAHLSEEIANNSPFRGFGGENDEEQDEFNPEPPQPLPMEQYYAHTHDDIHHSHKQPQIRKIDRPLILPHIHK